jgi:hypothetical protein
MQLSLLGVASGRGGAADRIPAGDQNGDHALGWPGGLDGLWHWRLPDTPNGLRPSQSWHATGSAPDGSIYVGGMDHVTNSALYGLKPEDGALRLLGDARSASEAVGNWRPGETAQKFHTRPLWHRDRIYVATLDRSTLDDEYLSRRGFHWYAYDPARDTFSDLSAAEPGGSATPHGGLVTLASDPRRNLIYGAAIPTAELFRYDVSHGRTEALGRPPSFDRPYVYTNRVMWLDTRGHLYFTAGHPFDRPQDPSIYAHIYYYDPDHGKFGERRDWKLKEPRALELGQCLLDQKVCFFSDDQGHIYRFADEPPSWSYLGKVELPAGPLSVWAFHASADGSRAYLATSRRGKSALYEFDLTAGSTRKLGVLADLDPAFEGLDMNTGYDTWDTAGRFYFTSFSGDPKQNVLLTSIDPVRLKVALGVLPILTEISVDRAPGSSVVPGFTFVRTGGISGTQKVHYKLLLRANEEPMSEYHGTVVIPHGAASVDITLREIKPSAAGAVSGGALTIIPNGSDYVAGRRCKVEF